jgi:RNA recognition motif-containing protein
MILISIENLSNETNEHELARLFSRYGKVSSIHLTLGAPHSRYPASGTLKMQGHDATKVVSALDGYLLRGMIMQVSELSGSDHSAPPISAETLQFHPVATGYPEGYLHQPFHVNSVEIVNDPALGTAESWHRYEIKNGKSRITGMHRGSLAEVREFAEDCAEAFNQRNSSKGKSTTKWSSRNKK